jgi:hypothetical protein
LRTPLHLDFLVVAASTIKLNGSLHDPAVQVVQETPLQRFASPVRGAATMPLGLCRDQLAGRIYVLAGALVSY